MAKIIEKQKRWEGFYFITDIDLSVNGNVEDVRQALKARVELVQYRDKSKRDTSIIIEEARKIHWLCRKAKIPFIVNDDVNLALDMEADGVHVGQEDTPPGEARRILGPDAIIGVSVASVEETKAAEAAGADYVAVSPVFSTGTKLDAGPGLGLDILIEIGRCTKLPIAAIGGVTIRNAPLVRVAGADLICAISASLAGGKVKENIKAIMEPR